LIHACAVELAYSREDEEPTSWTFDDLKLAAGPDAFYPASKFKLYGRQPLTFLQRESARVADKLRLLANNGDSAAGQAAAAAAVSAKPQIVEDLHCSSNYFNLRWSGERRLRNLVLALDWTPSEPARYLHQRPLNLDKAWVGEAASVELSESFEKAVARVPQILKCRTKDEGEGRRDVRKPKCLICRL
jgi:hypothetical protein